jgi:hypothetical protein
VIPGRQPTHYTLAAVPGNDHSDYAEFIVVTASIRQKTSTETWQVFPPSQLGPKFHLEQVLTPLAQFRVMSHQRP